MGRQIKEEKAKARAAIDTEQLNTCFSRYGGYPASCYEPAWGRKTSYLR